MPNKAMHADKQPRRVLLLASPVAHWRRGCMPVMATVKYKMKNKEASFLSRLLGGLSIVILILSFLLLPTLLSKQSQSNEQIQLATLRSSLEKDNFVLPYPTKISISFSDNVILRVILFLFLVSIGLLGEIYIEDKKISGLVHLINIIIGIIIGGGFLSSLILPFVPL
jgi:hypothetical protein